MAITRAQQFRQMLEEGGRIGFANGAQFRDAQKGKSISPGTKGRVGPGPDRRPQTRDDNPLFEQYEGTTQAGGTGFVTNLKEGVNIPDKDTRDRLKKTLRDKNPPPIFSLLDPRTQYNLAKRLPGAKMGTYRDLQKFKELYGGKLSGSQLAFIDDLLASTEEGTKAVSFDDYKKLIGQEFAFDLKGPPASIQGLGALEKYVPKTYEEFLFTERNKPGPYVSGDISGIGSMTNPGDLINPKTGLPYTDFEFEQLKRQYVGGKDDGPGSQIILDQRDPDDPGDDGDDSDDDDTQTGGGLALRFMSRGGRIGADKGGIMKASYDYDDAMAETFEEFLRLKKIKEIPADMEFDEYLDQLDIDVPYSRKNKGEQRIMAQEGGMMSPEGGIMDLETGRQMYFLGKLVKKATRAVKKITKSPLGKAALGVAALKFGPAIFGKGSLNPFLAKSVGGDTIFSGLGEILNKVGLVDTAGGLTTFGKFGIPLALLPFLTEEEQEQIASDRGKGLDIPYIRNNPYTFASQVGAGGSGMATAFLADGGRIGFDNGGYTFEQFMQDKSNVDKFINQEQLKKLYEKMMKEKEVREQKQMAADGGRIGYQEGSKEPVAKKTMPLLDMGGKEMDLRDDGGFVPIGRMEKADDVPARLSKNEFVFTADAVRNAGGGDVDKGAEVMYNMMKNLESGGEVSEESQGLEGAREMFQTSKRLEEVL